MADAVGFSLVLSGVLIAAAIIAGITAVYFKKRAHNRRLKNHFAAKKHSGGTSRL